MPSSIDVVESPRGFLVRLSGDFARANAFELQEIVSSQTGPVAFDFSQVRELDDLGIATLARLLAESGISRFAFRGLRQRQLRLLRYLGLSVDELTGSITYHGGAGGMFHSAAGGL